jgi:hypothetical protein
MIGKCLKELYRRRIRDGAIGIFLVGRANRVDSRSECGAWADL